MIQGPSESGFTMCDVRFTIYGFQKFVHRTSQIANRKSQIKKAALRSFFFVCPGQDSNLHTLASTSPSSWRVYQFHHLGVVGGAQNRTRTCTSLLTLVPETSASTNFAIWATCRITERLAPLFILQCGCKNNYFFKSMNHFHQKRKKNIRDFTFIYL